MLESLFKKVSRNKETPAQVFSCEFCEAFKSTIFTEHLRYEVGVFLLKYFTFRSSTYSYLIVWSFSMLITKTICAISISFFSIFSVTCFFYLWRFWSPQHEERSIQSNYQQSTRRCFCRFVGEIFRYERWFMKQCVRVTWNFWELLWRFLRYMSSTQLFLLKFSVIKFLMWSVYGKKLVAHGFHSW